MIVLQGLVTHVLVDLIYGKVAWFFFTIFLGLQLRLAVLHMRPRRNSNAKQRRGLSQRTCNIFNLGLKSLLSNM